MTDLGGRRAIVTGANAGLGLATAAGLAARGIAVVLAGRRLDRLEAAAASIRARTPTADLSVGLLDLADLSSVTAFAAEQRDAGPLHLLVNNAGLMLVPQREFTADGFELQMGVNHLGHFALTRGVWPALTAASGRVVSVSSIAHRMAGPFDPGMGELGPYAPFAAYAQSKLACLLFARGLDRRVRAVAKPGAGTVTSVAAHPGYVATTLFTRAEHPSLLDRLTSLITPVVGSRPGQGARSQLRAATDPGLTGGEFIGPRFVLRGRPHRAAPSAYALDRRAAAILWEISAEKTGGDFEF